MGEAGRMVIYAEVHCGGSLLRFVREISGIGLLAVLNTVRPEYCPEHLFNEHITVAWWN